MKKLLVVLFTLALTLSACSTDAEVTSYNLSKEADQFKVRRRITFINIRTNEILLSVEGVCSTQFDGKDLDVVCRIGDDSYQKHYVGLTTEMTYVVEQLEPNKVSKYKYEIVFKPDSIVPITIDME